jgi:hypothetical protein
MRAGSCSLTGGAPAGRDASSPDSGPGGAGCWRASLLPSILFHPGFDFLRAFASPQDIESLRLDWMRPQLTGRLHEELLCHDLVVGIALTGELPHRVEVLEYDRTTLRCVIDLSSGRACQASMRVRDSGVKSKVVDVRYAGGRAYTWRDDHLADLADPQTNLLTPGLLT